MASGFNHRGLYWMAQGCLALAMLSGALVFLSGFGMGGLPWVPSLVWTLAGELAGVLTVILLTVSRIRAPS